MILIPKRTNDAPGGSFLPEDYLAKKAERRSIIIWLFLFVVVSIGVIGAFFVTMRQRNVVFKVQKEIVKEYVAENVKLDQLKVLEQQKAEMLEKAEITTALIEKVPRSILLAELINRMPKEVTLTRMELKSKRIVEARRAKKQQVTGLAGPQTLAEIRKKQQQTQKKEEAKESHPMPPKFEFTLEITGLAATDQQVADYQSALQDCPILDQVELLSTVETTVDEVPMRKFKMEAMLRGGADARSIKPLHVPRINPTPMEAAVPKKPVNPLDPTVPLEPRSQQSDAEGAGGRGE